MKLAERRHRLIAFYRLPGNARQGATGRSFLCATNGRLAKMQEYSSRLDAPLRKVRIGSGDHRKHEKEKEMPKHAQSTHRSRDEDALFRRWSKRMSYLPGDAGDHAARDEFWQYEGFSDAEDRQILVLPAASAAPYWQARATSGRLPACPRYQ